MKTWKAGDGVILGRAGAGPKGVLGFGKTVAWKQQPMDYKPLEDQHQFVIDREVIEPDPIISFGKPPFLVSDQNLRPSGRRLLEGLGAAIEAAVRRLRPRSQALNPGIDILQFPDELENPNHYPEGAK